jgi:hypothetical protein
MIIWSWLFQWFTIKIAWEIKYEVEKQKKIWQMNSDTLDYKQNGKVLPFTSKNSEGGYKSEIVNSIHTASAVDIFFQ